MRNVPYMQDKKIIKATDYQKWQAVANMVSERAVNAQWTKSEQRSNGILMVF